MYLVLLFSVHNKVPTSEEKAMFTLETESVLYQFQMHGTLVSTQSTENPPNMQQDIPAVCIHIKGALNPNFCHFRTHINFSPILLSAKMKFMRIKIDLAQPHYDFQKGF